MKLFDIIQNFIHKAKMEAAKEYAIAPTSEGGDPSPEERKEGEERKGWIGMDLDGTLAYDDPLSGMSKIGDPVPKMLALVRKFQKEGYRVKIFTARASDSRQVPLIREWLKQNGLPDFEITNIKDYEMIRLYDDRAVQVIPNTGELVGAPSL